MSRALSLCLLFLCAAHVGAQTPTKLKISVSFNGQDAVGSEFAYELREAIRRSAGYDLGSDRDYVITIHVVTLNPDETQTQTRTIASVSYTMYNYLPLKKGDPETWYPIYLTSSVLI